MCQCPTAALPHDSFRERLSRLTIGCRRFLAHVRCGKKSRTGDGIQFERGLGLHERQSMACHGDVTRSRGEGCPCFLGIIDVYRLDFATKLKGPDMRRGDMVKGTRDEGELIRAPP